MITDSLDEEYMPLSAIQHFAFCPRQWGLIHIEGIWIENYLTASGRLLHDKADDPWFNECRKEMIISRSMPLVSKKLRLRGIADVVELIRNDNGVSIPGRNGLWQLLPVEYKRGKPKTDHCDALQLCAQAMCLEEMLNTKISKGHLFYGQIRRRAEVAFTETLRNEVVFAAEEMHRILAENKMPIGKLEKKCKACSLFDACNPQIESLRYMVHDYIKTEIGE